MTHQPYLNWMHSELDGGLSATNRVALEMHLATCAECETMWAALRSVDDLLRAAPMLAPRLGFTGRFKARLNQRTSRTRLFLGVITLGTSALSASALMVVVLMGVVLSFTNFAQHPATTTALLHTATLTFSSVSTVANALFVTVRGLANWVIANPTIWLCVPLAGLALAVWVYLLTKFMPAPMRTH